MEFKVTQVGGGRGNARYNNTSTEGFWSVVKLTSLSTAIKSLFNKEVTYSSTSIYVIHMVYVSRIN
jgi:hypothetical protein